MQIRPIYAADIFETVRIERWERQVAPALRDSPPPPCGMDLPCRMDLLELLREIRRPAGEQGRPCAAAAVARARARA